MLLRCIPGKVAVLSALVATLGIVHVASAREPDCKPRPAAKSTTDGEEPEVPLECVRIVSKRIRDPYCQVEAKDGKVKTTKVANAQDCLKVHGKIVRKPKGAIGLLQKSMK